MATAPPMLRLPPELMLRVSSFLNTTELGHYRLSCKTVEVNLFDSFAREFFTKRQFMIEQVSLEALVGIANHKTLSPYLTEIIISLDTLQDNARPQGSQPLQNIDRDILLATGHARDLLVQAFSQLPNLRIVGIRDYDGRGRWRDGPDALWRSYGWAFNGPERRPYRSRASPDSILPLILYALGETSTKPQNIEVFLRRNRLSDRSFELGFMQPRVVPILSGLKTLLLSLEDSMLPGYPSHPHRSEGNDYRQLKELLQHTPLLEHLRLNFANNEIPPTAPQIVLDWLGTSHTSPCPDGPPPVKLDHLTTLDLGMLGFTPDVLIRVVSKFAKLRELSFWKVALRAKGGKADEDECMWANFLPQLGKAFQAPDNVTRVMIGWVVESAYQHPSRVHCVKFAGRTSTDSNGEKNFENPEDIVSFRKRVGNNVREWLTELGEKAFLPSNRSPSVDSDFSVDSDVIEVLSDEDEDMSDEVDLDD